MLQSPHRLRNDLKCFEWDAKPYYTKAHEKSTAPLFARHDASSTGKHIVNTRPISEKWIQNDHNDKSQNNVAHIAVLDAMCTATLTACFRICYKYMYFKCTYTRKEFSSFSVHLSKIHQKRVSKDIFVIFSAKYRWEKLVYNVGVLNIFATK